MDADKLITEIYTIINALSDQNIGSLNGDTLSRLAVRLASYKASLGEHVAYAKKLELEAEATYKEAKAESYKELREAGKGSTDAGELKNLGLRDALDTLNTAKYNHTRLSTLSMDCHDLIDGIKSRLISLQTERMESNVF